MAQELVVPLLPADPRTFSGVAYSCMIAGAEREVPVKVYFVRFAPGARTNWHSHAGAQILIVSSGRCRYQTAGSPVREVGAGQSVRFEPGVRHWHGAAEGHAAEHLAINLDSRETRWQEQVSERDYASTTTTG